MRKIQSERAKLVRGSSFLSILIVLLLIYLFWEGLALKKAHLHNKDPYQQEAYVEFITQCEGPLSDETESYIQSRIESNRRAMIDLERRKEDYKRGKISREQYLESVAPIRQEFSDSPVLDFIYGEFLYAQEDPSRRWIVNPLAWEKLLAFEDPDVLPLLAFFLACFFIVERDQRSQMSELYRTTQEGSFHLLKSKHRLICTSGVVINLTFFLVKFLLIRGSFSFSSASAPLQSLRIFGSSDWSLSLRGAALVCVAARILASCYLGYFYLFLGLILRSNILQLTFCLMLFFFLAVLRRFFLRSLFFTPLILLDFSVMFRGSEEEIRFYH